MLKSRFTLVVLIGISLQAHSALKLEEVIVTAQKKESTLQDTPIALSAFGEMALEREGISSVEDLADNVPAMTIQPFPINTTTLRIYIRGIGLIDAQVTQDPPIGVYLDGAYIARSSALATDIADLQRIEVLRGPQGTLYGRNSTGGALNLISKRPNPDDLEFKQTLTTGSDHLFVSNTSVNVPLWQGAAGKFAYYKKSVDGPIENTGIGEDFGDNDTRGLRVDFGWDISEILRLDLAWDKTEAEITTRPFTYTGPKDQIPNPNANETIAVTNLLISGSSQFTSYDPRERRPDKVFSAVPIYAAKNVIEGKQLTFSWDFADSQQFKYIYAERDLADLTPVNNLATNVRTTGYRLDTLAYTGFDASPTPGGVPLCTPCVGRNREYAADNIPAYQEQFSHELQLMGSLFDDHLSYIVGLYFFEETASSDNGQLRLLLASPLGSDQDNNNTRSRLELLAAERFDIENTASAIFSQVSWTPPVLDERLKITLGARRSEDTREVDAFRRQVTFAVLPTGSGDNRIVSQNDTAIQAADDFYSVQNKRDFSDQSYSMIIEYVLGEDINLYGKYAEAYKSGGFNVRESINAAGAERFRNGFDPENVSAVELGMKARFLGGQLQVNTDVFEQVLEGQQLNFSVPNTFNDTTVANAEESVLKGFEMDVTLLAVKNLILIFNYAYLDASINPSTNPLSGELEAFVFDSAPRQAYTAAVDWTIVETDHYGRLALNASYSFTDERAGGAIAEFATFESDRLDDYGVFNGRIGLYDIQLDRGKGLLNVALWGKNILDEEFVIHANHAVPHAKRSILWGDPRSYGLDIIYRWAGS
jgi:iron complex outermembrane receptor protein